MSDIDTGAPVPSEGGEPGIRILAQFIRDLSMENPRAPEALRPAADQPQIDLGVEMDPVLLIECPRYLFPFARRIIAEVTSEGGFPPFLLDPIDFAGVYAARKAQAASQVVGNA